MFMLSDFSSGKAKGLKFIDILKQTWSDIHDRSDVFRYKIDKLQEKVIDGNYLLQLNPDRSSKRRTPEQIENICQPFDENKFNFTKASPNEIMFTLCDEDALKHVVLVNVSPISCYHSLLCPSLEKCLPQVVTEDSLLLVLKIMFLAGDRCRGLRIGFNSLCAMASVNHLHYHLFLEKNSLPIETINCTHLHKNISYFHEYPIPGFCFEVAEHNVLTVAMECYNLIEYFIKNSIAHNIFITRGSSVLSGSQKEVIRLIVWPRKSSAGAKQLAAFNVAVCEMSGWFPVYSAIDYETMQSETLEAELSKWKISEFENCTHLHKNISYFHEYPIPGFCFEVAEHNVLTVAMECYNLIEYFIKNSIAHNIFITRGSSVLSGSQKEVIRLIVWPRKSSAGAKQLAAFNVAVCEMSGWFPVYSAIDYETMQRETLEAELSKWKISEFEVLCDKIKQII